MSSHEMTLAMEMALVMTVNEFAATERHASNELARRVTVDTFDELVDENLVYQFEHEVFGDIFDISSNDPAFLGAIFDFVTDKASNAAWFSAFYNRNIPPEFMEKAVPVIDALLREGYAEYVKQRSRLDDLLTPSEEASRAFAAISEKFAADSQFVTIGNPFGDLLGRTSSALRTGIALYILWLAFLVFTSIVLKRVAETGCPESGTGVVILFANTFQSLGRTALIAAGDDTAAAGLTVAAEAAKAGAGAMQCSTAASGGAKAAQAILQSVHLRQLAQKYIFGFGTTFVFATNWWSDPLAGRPGVERRDRTRLDRFRRSRKKVKKSSRVKELEGARIIGCDVCGKPALHTCDDCGDALYCSEKCQKIEWQEGRHADECCAL
jgi:hypothetical protein